MASVSCRDVRKSFGTTQILHGVSVDIADREFVVLVGPSGCGKSTLLRMIAGLENITGGEIRIGERVVNHLPPKARDVAMVFQNYALYPHMTVAANMGFSLKLRGAPRAEIEARVQARRRDPGARTPPRPLPAPAVGRPAPARGHGARHRARPAGVPVRRAACPTSTPSCASPMRTEIKELHQRIETTTVYVTHDQIEAMTMADKIVVMHDGLVEQIGAPLDLYDRPDNMFVAGFIGSPAMNLLKGRISANGGGTFEGPGGTQPAAGDGAQRLRGAARRLRRAAGAFRPRRGRRRGRDRGG